MESQYPRERSSTYREPPVAREHVSLTTTSCDESEGELGGGGVVGADADQTLVTRGRGYTILRIQCRPKCNPDEGWVHSVQRLSTFPLRITE